MPRVARDLDRDASHTQTIRAARNPLAAFKRWYASRQAAQFQAGMNYWRQADPVERAFIEADPQTSSAFDRGILAARDVEPEYMTRR
jgi:hypothetical protein